MSQDGRDVPSAPTEDLSSGFLRPGQILGERYRIGEQLGRGGMGEVWRATDLKLRVEVALKAMREDLFRDEKRRDLLRQEVRAAREVVSPNVCRIFDLIEAEGRELVSMEYVDGGTLLDVLREHGPLDLKEAQDIASQFLAGLEAIHKAGLIHRDVKPENIMLTRAGRVVLMDFGLARQEDSGAGTVSGTPAYMAPEQAAGMKVDARADVYSAGVVLAEMVSPEGIKDLQSRESVWEGIRHEPARVPDSPWAPVLKKAVAKQPDQRYSSAHTLTRALEDVTLRVDGAEDLLPYPGLASFTETNAEYFFGREAEIEAMWARLDRPHMLAIIGPSGAGKSSFLRAGIIPAAGAGWAIATCTPGNAAFRSLRQELASQLAGDAEAMRELVDVEDLDAMVSAVSRWRRRHEHALLIVDQFEELFTQNTVEVQERFTTLLERLVLEADVFVLLSLRDDFFFHCHRFDALKPVVTDLTLLGPPAGAALRRAIVRPAMTCGYRFEDDELVEEMLAEVEGERGALPLLAFAMSRMWEQRARESGLITRQAHRDIGGVGGALAQHAETTIDRIGSDRLAIVRELFRNLVTAEGTRAVRDLGELLSIFDEGQRPAAEDVLRDLVDARLLTSYEVHEEDGEPNRRVEIIHESLLTSWPRLVGWRTQDADSARSRDELRQAARAWDEHGRSDDRLWTGTAYREFQVWRERYPGGLSKIEEAFAASMTAFTGRRRRRQRVVVAALLTIAAAVASVTTVLWRRSVLQERRAEAQKLVALGTVRLDDYPTAALAHFTKSIQIEDSDEARFLALKALWKGPTGFVVNNHATTVSRFSSQGSWLVQSPLFARIGTRVISRDGRQRVVKHSTFSAHTTLTAFFGGAEDLFVSFSLEDKGSVALISAPEARVLVSGRPVENPEGPQVGNFGIASGTARERAVLALTKGDLLTVHALNPDGSQERVGSLKMTVQPGQTGFACVPQASADWVGIVEGNKVSVARVTDDGLSNPMHLGRHDGALYPFCDADPLGRTFATLSFSGEIKLWDATGEHEPVSTMGPTGLYSSFFSSDGSYFYVASSNDRTTAEIWIWSVEGFDFHFRRQIEGGEIGWVEIDPVGHRLSMKGPLPASRLWSLGWPDGAEPIMLRHGAVNQMATAPLFSPDGEWLSTSDSSGLILWPLVRSYPAVIRHGYSSWNGGAEFGPDGRYLVTSVARTVSLYPLVGPTAAAGRTLLDTKMRRGSLSGVAISANGEFFAASGSGRVWVSRVDGGQPRELDIETLRVAFSPDGRKLALNRGRIIDLDGVPQGSNLGPVSAQEIPMHTLPGDDFGIYFSFADDGRLLSGSTRGVSAWDVESGEHERLVERDASVFAASADGRRLLVLDGGGEGGLTQDPLAPPVFFDLDTGAATTLSTHGMRVWSLALNREGTVAVTGDRSGIVRVGPVTGEEPHLLLGHEEGDITHLAVDPTGRWIASSSQDGTVRLWPMPDITKPPLHTLPREVLIAKLETLTNLRLVRDPESSTGWKLTHEPFQGWETAPTW